jgi:acyl dehydratase
MPPLAVENLESLRGFVGREIGVTDWFTLTQERIQQFAEATEDRQWIHVDRARAQKESPYGATIAHGFLTLSLLSHFLKQALEIRGGMRMGINCGLNRVRFPSAVPAGSKIRAHVSLHSLKELPDCVEATFSISVECEGAEKPCCVAEWIVRYYS